VDGGTYSELVNAIGGLLERARSKIAAVANFEQVRTYWETGRYIVEYEQNGSDRAKYGTGLIDRLAHDLTAREGRGYSKTNILYMRKLYLAFRKGETLSHFLSWSHYMLILKKAEGLEIEFYCKECEASHWTVRELRRQIDSSLFERLALSKDKKGVLALAHKGNEVVGAGTVPEGCAWCGEHLTRGHGTEPRHRGGEGFRLPARVKRVILIGRDL